MRKFSQFTPDEDTPLLLSWYRGDLTAFETLIWKYQKRIFNLALLLTGAQQTACEVTENSFVTAYQNIKSLKSTGRFSSWLAAIALRECRELADRREEFEPPTGPDSEPDEEADYSAAVNRKLELCIRELPVELSELILLRYVRGHSLDRMAEIVQISGEQLRSRLFEAQEMLAGWLKSGTENPAELAALKTAVSPRHPEIRRHFSAYLDNSAEGDEKELTKAHLKSCGSCREALAELEWMVEDIKSIPDVEPPPWLALSILEKIKASPVRSARAADSSPRKIPFALAALFIAIIGAAGFLLQDNPVSQSENQRSTDQQVPSPTVEQKAETSASSGPSALKGILRGDVTSPAGSPVAEPLPRPSVPLPSTLPSEGGSAAPSLKPLLPPAAEQKMENAEALSPLLREWGDPPPHTTPPQKKAPLPRARSSELALILTGTDPVAAAQAIENAVTALGGKVNGRAYSGGTDIMYTRVEVDRFYDLVSRLGKLGRIQELPQPPEGTEGAIDLVIRW